MMIMIVKEVSETRLKMHVFIIFGETVPVIPLFYRGFDCRTRFSLAEFARLLCIDVQLEYKADARRQ